MEQNNASVAAGGQQAQGQEQAPSASYVTLTRELEQKRQIARMQFDLSQVGQMVKEFEAKQRMAQMFAQSKIVPQTYQNNVADCAIAIDMAMRMNCNPLTVMQNLVIVQGRPTWQAQFLIACINQCGKFTTLQYKQWEDGKVGMLEYEDNVWDPDTRRNKLVKKTFNGKDVPNYCCQAYATDLQTGEVVYGTEISMKMAVAERWVTKSGSKWLTMPRQMLIYRAASFFQRAYCPEIGMGFHTTDEIEDAVVVGEGGGTAPSAAQKQPSTGRARLADLAFSAAADFADVADETNKANVTDKSDKAEELNGTDVKPKKTLL